VVIGVADPSKETFGRASLVLATGTNRGLRYAGRAAVGRNELGALSDVVPQLRRATPPCRCGLRAAVWLEPAVVCEVRFLASSRRGLRHPTFIRFRPDKVWTECIA
jgi:ATP-dependent DNA ligase